MLPEQLDAVIFDAGGTLVEIDFAAVAQIARGRGVVLEESELRRAERASRQAIDAHYRAVGNVTGTDATRRVGYFGNLLRAAGVEAEAARAIVDDLEVANLEANLWRVPLAEAAETLQGLRARGLRTAVVSNADGRVEALLSTAGLRPHLEFVLDSHYEGVEKPDPEIFRRALARLGVPGERALYVGDIYAIDVVGARAAGLAPVLIDSVGAYGEVDCPRIERLSDLLDRLPRRA